MKLAVIETGGKQYLVAEGQTLKVEKLKAEAGQTLDLDQVFLTFEDDKMVMGKPLTGSKVAIKILAQGRGAKIRVEKYKPKVRYHKVYGHRQPFTEIEIAKIS